jgi:hypothetical protein
MSGTTRLITADDTGGYDDQEQLLPGSSLAELPTASDWCQRWRHRQHSWRRPEDGGFDARCYEVHPIDETTAKQYVVTHHYSQSYPAAAYRFGLFEIVSGELRLAGVAVFGIPVQAAVLTKALPGLEPYRAALEFSRLVLDDTCPGNSESWFIARCFNELLVAGVQGVVSFADPVPRQAADGRVTAVGHCGRIYQATNAAYCGRATPRTLALLPDGTVLNGRAMQKVRRQEQGHDHVEQRLIALGAAVLLAGQDPALWLRGALEDIGARRLRHRGNHRYVFRLGRNRRERERIRLGLPEIPLYPKHLDLAA